MEFSDNTEGYYRRMLHLQDKLRKSEEERLKLEEKFHEMMQHSRDVEHERLRIMRHRYHKFLEEDKTRQERNENILRALDRIEHRAKSLAAKTDRFKTFRKQYFDHYFKHLPPPVRPPQAQPMRESYTTNIRKKLFPDSPSKSNENIEAKLALLEKYLRDNFDNFPGDGDTNSTPLEKQPPLNYNDNRLTNENDVQEHEDMYKKYLSKKMANGLHEFTTPRYNTVESERNKLLGESIEKELEELRNKNVEPNNNSINIQKNNAEHLIHDYKNLVSKSKEMYGLDDLPVPTLSTKTEQEYLNPSNNNLTTFNRKSNFEDIQTTKPKSNIVELPVPQEPLFASNRNLEENTNVDHEANEQHKNISLVSPKDQDLSTETKPPSDISLNMPSPSQNKNLVNEEMLSERDVMKNVVEDLENKNNENMQEETDEATIIENQLSVAPKEDSSYIESKQFDEVSQNKSELSLAKTQDEVEELVGQEYEQTYNDIQDEVSQNQEEYLTQPYQQEVSNVEQFDSNVNEFGETVYDEEQYQQEPEQYQEEPQAEEYVEGNEQEQYSQQVEEQNYVEQQEPYVEEQYAQEQEEQSKLYAEQEQYKEGQIVEGNEQYNQQQDQYVEGQEMYNQNNEEYEQQQYNEGGEQQPYTEEQGIYDEKQEYNEEQPAEQGIYDEKQEYNEEQPAEQFIEGQEQFAENQEQYMEEQSSYQENQEQYLPQEGYEHENLNTEQYVENLEQEGQDNYQQEYAQQDYPAYQQQQDETLQEYPQEQGEYNAEYSQENYAPVDQQYAENLENYDAQNVYQTQQEYIEGEQNIDMQYQEQNQYVQDPVSQEYQQEQGIEDGLGSQPQLDVSETIEEPSMPIIEKKLPNLADMLDTDTSESVKQDTKVSNDSDFDFTNT